MDIFLQTKLAAPLIRDLLVPRVRLFQRLEDGLLHEGKSQRRFASVITAPYGRILARRDGDSEGEAFALVTDVPLETGNKFLVKLGDWVGWLALGLPAFMVFQNMVKRKRRESKSTSSL